MSYVFMFPGQGSQSVGMGKDLYEKYDLARKLFDDANGILGIDIKKYCFEGPIEELTLTNIVQPAVTLLNIVIYSLLKDKGIVPDVVCGHSLGEYTALYAAGVLDLESVLKLVRARGTYMQEAADENPGGMIAVIGLPFEKVNDLCAAAKDKGTACIANFNTREQLIVSGHKAAVDDVLEKASAEGVKVVPLNVSGPWHSSLMEKAKIRMVEEEDKYSFNDPIIPIVCNVTADYAKSGDEIKENLVLQVTGSVRWLETVERLQSDHPGGTYIEAGPGRVLKGLARSIDRSLNVNNINNAVTFESFVSQTATTE